jgi:predicted amidohydrolase
MTADRNLKRRIRARAARTGESYTAARRNVVRPRAALPVGEEPEPRPLRLAVAQTVVRQDPGDRVGLRRSGHELRVAMRAAREAGARVVHFPEGATCFPHKLIMSVNGPDEVGPADWTRCAWDVLRDELDRIASLAAELRLWTVLGSVHRLTEPHRPHNSMYVISDGGTPATRYDERYLSATKLAHLYTPGSAPVTFEVDGTRFGCALGMETHFPEVFDEYERLDVDCVLVSTTGDGAGDGSMFATECQGHAAVNSYWVSFAVATSSAPAAGAGVLAPTGRWVRRCGSDGPDLVVVDLGDTSEEVQTAISRARPWRRTARAGLYDAHVVREDPRSSHRGSF